MLMASGWFLVLSLSICTTGRVITGQFYLLISFIDSRREQPAISRHVTVLAAFSALPYLDLTVDLLLQQLLLLASLPAVQYIKMCRCKKHQKLQVFRNREAITIDKAADSNQNEFYEWKAGARNLTHRQQQKVLQNHVKSRNRKVLQSLFIRVISGNCTPIVTLAVLLMRKQLSGAESVTTPGYPCETSNAEFDRLIPAA
jgi:hypothetical protein